MKDRDLKSLFERLSTRGTPRGAADVLEAARTRAATRRASGTTERPLTAIRRYVPVLAIAASISLIGGVAAAIVVNRGSSSSPQFAAHGLNTLPPSSTTTGPQVPEISIPAKLIAASRLVPFSNCGTFTSYMRAKGLQYVSAYGLPSIGGAGPGGVMMATGGVAERNSAGAPAAASAGDSKTAASPPPAAATAGDGGYSTTNVQEAGIDEPDIVKTDGKRIYALSNGKLFIVDAAQPRILGSLDVGYSTDMFVVGDRAVVFSNAGNTPYPMSSGGVASSGPARPVSPYPYRQQTRITVLDVANPAAIKEVSHLDVDGAYVSARLVNGVARVVISSYSNMQFAYPADGTPAAQDAALQKNRDLVRNAKFDDWVPHYTVTNAAGKTSAARPAVACDSAYRPPQFSGFGQLSVLSLDPRNPTSAKSTSVAADGQIVYGSATRLYVATSQWGEVRPMTAGAMPDVAPVPKTLVHNFDISDPTQARYIDSGAVRGTPLNQFSFSEFQGNLRVATTDGAESFVTVLADQGKILTQVGQVGGLGKGERIYAVRFIGALGYVVTFRQVDPLYVIDLHAPTRPRVVGELKVLGYSAYLHPVSDTLLIGVGQDATPEGRRAGTQVSLFDVSNPAAPRLLQRLPFGQGNSQAEYDHHAFLYWAAKQLAVIPLQEYDPNKGGPGFMGAVGMHVSPSEIREVGRVTHMSSNYGGMISRSMVIDGHLFTYSDAGIKASNLDTLADQVWVPFPQQQQPPPEGPQPQTKPGSAPPAPPSSSGASSGPA